ncbi:DUF3263 domain-containing protein [Streptomyces sp. NP160]|nr:DUF3263 domain-containing protein [Streptomyces sp. NP160]
MQPDQVLLDRGQGAGPAGVDDGEGGGGHGPTLPCPGRLCQGGPVALSQLDLAVLAVERRTFRRRGEKEQAVRDELDLSATRYYQRLNALLDDPEALAADPVLVGRLRRLRDERTAGRDLDVGPAPRGQRDDRQDPPG